MDKFDHSSILTTKQFSLEDLDIIFNTATDMDKLLSYGEKGNLLNNKVMASLFFEASTRTRLSFESAMHKLGGSVITVSDSCTSSMSKGETIEDTSKIISIYADILVIRHPQIGSVEQAAAATDKPVINAGDGGNQHPTQALLDMYTIYKERGRLTDLKIAIIGDLKYGRTAHSLVFLGGLYSNVEFVFISPEELKMPRKVMEFLKKKNIKFTETQDYVEGLTDCDVAYVTRIQKERFPDASEYDKLKDRFIMTKDTIKKAKPDITIMHPLPRVNEVALEIDELPNAAFFRQAANGLPIRMALLYLLLKKPYYGNKLF